MKGFEFYPRAKGLLGEGQEQIYGMKRVPPSMVGWSKTVYLGPEFWKRIEHWKI